MSGWILCHSNAIGWLRMNLNEGLNASRTENTALSKLMGLANICKYHQASMQRTELDTFVTHCSLVTSNGDIDLVQHWIRWLLDAIRIYVMACCMVAPSHYLNKCWFIVFVCLFVFPVLNLQTNFSSMLNKPSIFPWWFWKTLTHLQFRMRYLNIEDFQHNDVIKWKHFPRYWPFVRGIHRSPVNSPTKASDAELWWFL